MVAMGISKETYSPGGGEEWSKTRLEFVTGLPNPNMLWIGQTGCIQNKAALGCGTTWNKRNSRPVPLLQGSCPKEVTQI